MTLWAANFGVISMLFLVYQCLSYSIS